MTKPGKPVTRETGYAVRGRPVVVTLAPCGSQNEAVLVLRRKGERTAYAVALSDVYRMAALWHGQKEAKARSDARKAGVPWRTARRRFLLSIREAARGR